MVIVTFEEVVCRKLVGAKADYRLVIPSEGYRQVELKSPYRYGVDVIGWTNPFLHSINFGPLDGPIHIVLDLRRKARMDFHGHIVCSYSLDLDGNCDSKTFVLQASQSSITAPPEIHTIITVTDLSEETTRRIDLEVNATNPAADSSPLPPHLDASAADTASSDVANVENPAVFESAADPSEEVTHSASSSVPVADEVPLVLQLDAARGATKDASDQQARLWDRELPLSALAGNDAAPDVAAVGVASWDAAQCVELLVEALDNVAEIHPIANAAWKIITLAYKLKEQQSQTDEEVDKLVKSMDANCRLAVVLVKNELASTTVPILRNILEAVSNGATVVEQYCRIRRSFLSSFKLVGSTIASRIVACLEVLAALERELGGHTLANIQHDLQTVASSLSQNHNDLLVRLKRLDEDLVARKSESLLGDMVYAAKADRDLHDDDRGCLPDTRVEIIQAIVDWATGDPLGDSNSYIRGLNPSSRVLWLCGVAGSGKSSIAISVARALRSKNPPQLCALYGFETAYQKSLNPKSLFSTIARQRAERRPAQKQHLLHVLEQMDRDQRATTSVSEQFRCFLASTSTVDVDTPDDVIVIDAFDESGSVSQRAAALLALSPTPSDPTFPEGIRFIVTSRYEPDVAQRLETVAASNRSQCSVLRMEDIHPGHTERDIERYVIHMLDRTHGLEARRAAGDLARLAVTAEHSFQWASTACRYIVNSDDQDGARLPDERIAETLETRGGLDKLYLSVLNQSFRASMTKESPATRSLRMILGTLVCAPEPASVQIIAALASADQSVQTVDLTSFHILARKLSSIITGTQTTSTPLVAFHTSFTDFLANTQRSKGYAVDSAEVHLHMALGSLAVMRKLLRFNICKLESSFARNDAVPDLPKRIKQHIPDELLYASRFWPAHVAAALSSYSPDLKPLRQSLSEFLKNKLLLLQWLEVMSVTGADAYASLSWLFSLQANNSDLSDLLLFITTFSIPITLSVPHIYLSALAFAPSSSTLVPTMTDFSNLVRPDNPLLSWPQVLHKLEHPLEVQSVAWSPDGRWLVSGEGERWESMDDAGGAVCLWDVYLGRLVLPRVATTSAVLSVAVSRDGSLLASGHKDGTIQVWDAHTLATNGSPLQVQSHSVQSVAFSPTSSLLASGSGDNMVALWDAVSHSMIGDRLEGHSNWVYSVAFSSDGTLLLSGSLDHTIRLWNVQTQSAMGDALEGHTDWVRCGSFSPDGSLLASSSDDKTVCLWDVRSGTAVGKPLAWHSGAVRSVAFSPPLGETLASCSVDKTVRLWDVRSRYPLGEPLTGHTGSVNSVAFSPDGSLLASGSSDKTVHICDAIILSSSRESPATQFRIQDFAAFSRDGKLLASGSDDHAIQLWDVHSVSPLGEPLKGHTSSVCSVAFSPDGTLLASGSEDKTVRLWDVGTASAAGEPLEGHNSRIHAVTFSPDGTRLASASNNGTIRLWDVDTRSSIREPFKAHDDWIRSIAFSSNGLLLASSSDDTTLRLWDMRTLSALGKPLEGHNGYIRSVAFSPDATLIASGSDDMSIRLWDAQTQSAIGAPLKGHTGYVTSLTFSPDGMLLASCSYFENVVRVWDVRVPSEVGEPVALLRHESNLFSITFLSEFAFLSSVTSGGVVRKWDSGSLLSTQIANVHIKPKDGLENHSLSPVLLPNHPDLGILSPDSLVNLDDGWVVGLNKELIMWIPPAVRPLLYDLGELERFGGPPRVTLDFADFVCGSDWAKCYSPPPSSSHL